MHCAARREFPAVPIPDEKGEERHRETDSSHGARTVNQEIDLSKLLRLRKVTRAVAEHFRSQLDAHLRSLQPLFKPTNVLGEHIRNAPTQTLKIADASLKELRSLYARIGRAKPFRFDDDLRPPIDVFGSTAELNPVTYIYSPQGAEDAKPITVTSPLKWVLSYKGLGPGQLQELLVSQSGTARLELRACLLHYLVLHIILAQEHGAAPILRALRFELSIEYLDRLGGIPMAYVAAPVQTVLPSDEAIIQSTELSGASVFEELVDIDSIVQMKDPVKDDLLELVAGFGGNLVRPGTE